MTISLGRSSMESQKLAQQSAADKLRSDASTMIPSIIEQHDAVMRELVEAHLADSESYGFRCERHGDFLALFVERGRVTSVSVGGKIETPNRVVTSINLARVQWIAITPGHAPDMSGAVRFAMSGYSGERSISAIYQNDIRTATYWRMFADDPVPQSVGGIMGMAPSGEEALSGLHIPDSPRGPSDDQIYFHGLGVSLYAPAGHGQRVFDTIMREIAA